MCVCVSVHEFERKDRHICAYARVCVYVCVIMCVTVCLQTPTVGQVLLMLIMTYDNVTSVLHMAKLHVLV